ncbi:hypothetical protein ACQEWB_49500 [Streptomyces sp. CA-249302]|uniref:hypothetical protein n=1 Tax=Streptomyces sp. CA-249302 TaxID=3240058 RepID=UPI003D927833
MADLIGIQGAQDEYASFSNTVGCHAFHTEAAFSGGEVPFTSASGVAPHHLVPAPGQPLPAGLAIPQHWQKRR